MTKTNANFNLSKPAKKLIGTGKNKVERGLIKKAFIDAEHASSQPFKAPRQRDNNGQPNKQQGK
jgi:hypothetical protein